jgi:hypothetical protein
LQRRPSTAKRAPAVNGLLPPLGARLQPARVSVGEQIDELCTSPTRWMIQTPELQVKAWLYTINCLDGNIGLAET